MGFLRHSALAIRVLWAVLLASFAVFAVATAYGVSRERDTALQAAHSDAQETAEQSLKAISTSLWQYDIAGLNAQLTGMVASRVVVRAEVMGMDKQVADVLQPGFTGPIDRVWSLPVLAPDQRTTIGSLRISESYAETHAHVDETLQTLVLTDLFKIIGLALVLFAIVYRMIARHLGKLAYDVTHLGTSDQSPKLALSRKKSATYHDEIDILVDAINRFVAQRYASQEALEESQERHRALSEAAFEAIFISEKGICLEQNSQAELMFGYSIEEAKGRAGTEWIAPADRARVMLNIATGFEQPYEVMGLRKDGATFPAIIRARMMHYKNRGVRVTSMRDISERKEAEQALRIAATAFESQQGMTITDAHRVILRVNRAFTKITGYNSEEVVGKTPSLLSSGRHDKVFYKEMNQALERKGTWAGEIWNRRKNGEIYPEWLSISAVKDDGGAVTHFVAIFNDVSDRVNAQAQIDTLAFYDPLTLLPNRRLLLDRLEQALHVSSRHARKSALLFVELDNFKTLNDPLGHHQGDLLLVQVAQRIKTCIREGDTVARLGSDEFVVMLENLSEDEIEAATQAETVADKILGAFAEDFPIGQRAHHTTPSIGITLFGGGSAETSEQPLKRAELAMFQAKAAGRNTMRFFDAKMQAEVSTRAALEADLREAVQGQHFELYYQPQVVGAGRVTGVEALLRWPHAQRGMVSPAEFIPLAEETGLILTIGQWVLDTACVQLAAWADDPALAHLTVAVNVSARQIQQADFVDKVLGTLVRTRANPRLLKLELTESMLVNSVEEIIEKMDALKNRGVGFSLDDFGTGYSSLSYLKRLPLAQLKIDQGFVRNIVTDPNDAAIAKMVVALAESLGLAVIAEGVELQAQADFLAHLGCHAYQGYLFSRPLPLDALKAYASALTLGR